MHASVSLHIAAPPLKVWELVSDITRMGEYSPEVFEAEWLDGATGPALGATYRGHVKRNEVGPTYWTTCKVTACEPGEVFEFAVIMGGKALNTSRYDFAPGTDGGSRNNFAATARWARYDVPVVMRRVFRNIRTPSVTRRHQLSR